MKKNILLLCFCAALILASGCFGITSATHVACLGVNQFSTEHSSRSLCKYIWPPYGPYNERVDKEPILLFKYDNSDSDFVYTLDEDGLLYNTKETVLSYIRYDDAQYEIAKNEFVSATPVSEIYKYEYNSYKFFLNLTELIEKGEIFEEIENSELDFHYFFNMICYNDDKNLLLSIGFAYTPDSASAKENDKSSLIYTDIGAFLKEYFYYYDFDAETPSIDADALKKIYGKRLEQ